MNNIESYPHYPTFTAPSHPNIAEAAEIAAQPIDRSAIRAWMALALLVLVMVSLQIVLQHALAVQGHTAPVEIDWSDFGSQLIP